MADIVEKFAAYMEKHGFEDEVRAFLKAHIKSLEFTAVEEEQSMRNTAVFNEFMGILEAKMNGFLKDEGVDEEEFQAQCVAVRNQDGRLGSLVHRLMALGDYDSFMDLAMGFGEGGAVGDTLEGDCEDDGDFMGEEKVPTPPPPLDPLADIESDDDY